MARTKQTARKSAGLPPRPRPQLAVMRASVRRPTPLPNPKTRKRERSEDIGLSAEIRRLEADIAEHPFPESERPRQAPAMTRYRAVPREAPKKKKRRRNRKKKPETETLGLLTKPEVIDLTEEDDLSLADSLSLATFKTPSEPALVGLGDGFVLSSKNSRLRRILPSSPSTTEPLTSGLVQAEFLPTVADLATRFLAPRTSSLNPLSFLASSFLSRL
ncbi:hypothetical protein EDB83DRAFT_2317378 [Lactarius deliciosus]|nr:hypothetical protein EDB83DRAFT_2317378 [Lactarius deliciosus]